MIINHLRTYYPLSTGGRLFLDGVELPGATLEDVGRPAGVKIQDETCIPEGTYQAVITHSNRFKKDMILLYNDNADKSVRSGTAVWTGIRVHDGIKTSHTAGCVLYPGYQNLQDKIAAEIATGKPVYWIIGHKNV